MGKIYIRTKGFISNKLLHRKQMTVEVLHKGKGTVPKKEVQEKLAAMFRVKDASTVIAFGFKTKFGASISTGTAVIYDNSTFCKRFEPRYRLLRNGLATKKTGSRKQRKEKKNRMAKYRGITKINGPTKKKS
eukprot:NODE_9692_length_508_cov_30.503937_g9669_i0.p2 GENE.NODE_9692_length_508_cov_30.503937_g9669_i0~~NODE_9692_length_508_cov_30.503937_g9669_i0.p2  ORF type:complete len:144 (+),score=50.62 NODE_9692_length_508_cov_30.503937_g9669_i0:38-433(+)